MVDNVDGDEKCLWVQFVLKMNVDEPVEQYDSHVFSDVWLLVKVVVVDWSRSNLTQKKLQYLFFINLFLTLSFFFDLLKDFMLHFCVHSGFVTKSNHTFGRWFLHWTWVDILLVLISVS